MDFLKLEDVEYSYPDEKTIFEGLCLDLKEGDKVGIVGPNGSGKTTLFNVIMGFLKPSQGRIWVWGRERLEEKDFAQVRRKTGYLFQDPDDQVFSPSVEEDIAFGPLNLGQTPEAALEKAREILAQFGISALQKKVPMKLSWGEKRLVALAGVIAMEPDAFLMDEPAAGLDDKARAQMLDFIKNSPKAFLIASHDRQFLESCSSRTFDLAGLT